VTPRDGERGTAGRPEGVEAPGVEFGRAAAAVELRPEGDAHLGQRLRGEVASVDEVVAGVGAHLRQRPLGAGEHHRPVDPTQEEGHRAGRVRHRVGAVHHHHALVPQRPGVVARAQPRVDGLGDLHPVVGLHVAGVEGEENPRLDLGDAREHGHLGHDVAGVHLGHEGRGVAPGHHEGAASVKQEQAHDGRR
jgi:hypothetical protein